MDTSTKSARVVVDVRWNRRLGSRENALDAVKDSGFKVLDEGEAPLLGEGGRPILVEALVKELEELERQDARYMFLRKPNEEGRVMLLVLS